MFRRRAIHKYYKTMNDIAEFARSRPNVNYRHFFKPSEELGGTKDELDFRNSTTWRFQEIGRADAKAALDSAANGTDDSPLFSFSQIMEAHYNNIVNELGNLTSAFLN